jgi:hypothetical protein
MLPLYQDGWFTFRFTEDRVIPRFHLEGVPRGQCISVFKVEPETGEWFALLATATVGVEGCVDLVVPIIVEASDVLIAVPEQQR